MPPKRSWIAGHACVHNDVRTVAAERSFAGGHLVKNRAKAVDNPVLLGRRGCRRSCSVHHVIRHAHRGHWKPTKVRRRALCERAMPEIHDTDGARRCRTHDVFGASSRDGRLTVFAPCESSASQMRLAILTASRHLAADECSLKVHAERLCLRDIPSRWTVSFFSQTPKLIFKIYGWSGLRPISLFALSAGRSPRYQLSSLKMRDFHGQQVGYAI